MKHKMGIPVDDAIEARKTYRRDRSKYADMKRRRKKGDGREGKVGKGGRLLSVLAVFAALLALVAVAALYYVFYMPNDEEVSYFTGSGPYMVIEGTPYSGAAPKIIDDEILLPFEAVKQYIDPYIHWDPAAKKVTITTKDRVIRMRTGSLDAYVNDKPMLMNIPALIENGTVYIPIEFLADFYGIEISAVSTKDSVSGTEDTGSANTGSANTGSANTGSANTSSANTSSANTGSTGIRSTVADNAAHRYKVFEDPASAVIIIDFKNSLRQIAEPITPEAVIRTGPSVKRPIIRRFDTSIDANADADTDTDAEVTNGTANDGAAVDGTGNDGTANDGTANDGTDTVEEWYAGITGKPGYQLRIFEEYDAWYKVRTGIGEIGYVRKKDVAVKRFFVNKVPETERKDPAWKPETGKIGLVWEMMYGKRPDFDDIGAMPGIDVVSPTWFSMADTAGNVKNNADARYIEWARHNGYKVWVLFSNGFDSPDDTGLFLNNTDARENAIRQVLALAALYGADGINIDFENINLQDKDALTQFVREITPFLHEQGLVVSIDVTNPSLSPNWSLCYDRNELGAVADYVMLMSYDQYYAGSKVAGSVSQLSWVEDRLKLVLDEVPAEKLILGMPFYARLWKEEKDASGSYKVTGSKALSMDDTASLALEKGAKIVWDEASAQFYIEYDEDGAKYKLWMEDENSLNLRLALVHKYKLAGAAYWKRSDASEKAWQIVHSGLKGTVSFYDWQEKNPPKQYVYGE